MVVSVVSVPAVLKSSSSSLSEELELFLDTVVGSGGFFGATGGLEDFICKH